MRRAGLGLLTLSFILGLAPGARAQAPDRQVVLLLLEGVSFEDALADEGLRGLARAGGIGLMTTAAATEGPAAGYVTLGAGAPAGAPGEPVAVTLGGATVQVHARPYRDASPSAVPGALATAVEGAGGEVGYVALNLGGAISNGVLVAMDERGIVEPAVVASGFEQASSVLRSGVLDADLVVAEPGLAPGPGLTQALRLFAARAPADEVLVVVAAAEPSRLMRTTGDTVAPIVIAAGSPRELVGAGGPPNGLTSSTTRRDGLVANVDVAPTILDFLGISVPASMTGSPIRVAGEAPVELHARYLEYRAAVRPVGITTLVVTLVSLVAGGALLLLTRGGPRWLAAALAVAGLFGVALQVAMLPGSYLPSFDVARTLAVLAGGAGALTAVALLLGRANRAFVPVAVVGGAGVGAVAVDGTLGWPALVTPLLGGSALDGVRFFGLGNSYAGVLLAGVVLVAALLPTAAGAALIAGAALFAGLPWIGADLGGGLTLFAVAGLWVALRTRERFDLVAVAIVAGAFVVGAVAILGAHQLAEDPTHVTRATADPSGLSGIAGTFVHRLRLNLEATAGTPVVWPTLLGLPVWLLVAWRRAGPFRRPLQENDAWRDAAIALAVGGILGYVLNDTFGMASIAFLYLSLAMVFSALAVRWKSA